MSMHNFYDRFDAGATIYEASRPKLADQFGKVLKLYHPDSIETIVDVGCGTGLSSEQLTKHAKRVIGIDPNKNMLSIARTKENSRLNFLEGTSDALPLKDKCADVIVVSQAFHWMEPTTTLKEFDRVLKNGGMVCLVDYDWDFMLGARIEQVLIELRLQIKKWMQFRNISTQPPYPKSDHLHALKKSKCFSYVRELNYTQWSIFDAKRLMACELSKSSVQELLPKLSNQERNILDGYYQLLIEQMLSPIEGAILYTCRLGIK